MIKIRPLPFFFIAALALATSTGCAGKQESGPSINKQESGPSINKTATPGLCQTITPFKKLFNAIDKAGKGYFQADDLKSFLDALVSWYVPSKITKEMSETAVKELDSNSDGQITLNEAVAAFKINIPSEIKHDHIPKMVCTTKALAIFDRFDKNSDNTLSSMNSSSKGCHLSPKDKQNAFFQNCLRSLLM